MLRLITKTQTVHEVLAHNHFLELVLERFDIRLNECNGTLECISKSNGLELDFLVEILNLFDNDEQFPRNTLSYYPIPVILDYLQRTHKYYLGKRLFELERTIQIIHDDFPDDNRLCPLLDNFFAEFKTELWEHIELEENYLFPHIQFLMTCAQAGKKTQWLQRKLKNFSLEQFIADHNDNSEQRLLEIQMFIGDSCRPMHRFSPLHIFLKQAQGFEKDLRIHALVEDDVLIPKALEMEQQLRAV
jgi:regulator of cell morphogenesis and NO signaling